MIKPFPETPSNTVNLCQHHVQKRVLVCSLPPPSQSHWAKELFPPAALTTHMLKDAKDSV